MSRSSDRDPYRSAIREFNRQGVRYVVVGMSGVNYYADNPAETFATLDYDVFLDPSMANVKQAVQALRRLGFTMGTSAGELKPEALPTVIRGRRTLTATTPDGLTIELFLEISGYPFSELAKDAGTFTVGGVPIRVGRLEKLLRSKKLAGRPKDRLFLKRYQALLEGRKSR